MKTTTTLSHLARIADLKLCHLPTRALYDIIFLGPSTFEISKKPLDDTFENIFLEQEVELVDNYLELIDFVGGRQKFHAFRLLPLNFETDI